MKTLALLAFFTLVTTSIFAQENNKSNAVWRENNNGNSYQMEVAAKQQAQKTAGKPHIAFSIIGELADLEKVVFVKHDQLKVDLALTKKNQDIMVEPGLYHFKFYHKKMGEKEFEMELKQGDDKVVVLTLR